MFKLIVLSAFVALAAAKPSLIHEPVLHAAPLIAAPTITKIVQPAPLLVKSDAHVGSVISSIPTGVSSYSSSVVHGTGSIVTPVVTPVHKTVITPHIVSEPIVSAPIYKTISHGPIISEPILKTYAAAPAFSYSHAPIALNAPAIW